MSEKVKIILKAVKRGDMSVAAIATKADCSVAYVGKVINEYGLNKPQVPRAKKSDNPELKKKLESQIKQVRSLLKNQSTEQILSTYPELRDALICVLYESNSLSVIQLALASSGIHLSRERVRQIVGDRIVQRKRVVQKPRKRATVKQSEPKILELFDSGIGLLTIADQTNHSPDTVRKVLLEHGRSVKDRAIANKPYQVGDRVHNWEIIAYHNPTSFLCRDVRNGIERVVSIQNLRSGKSTGCRELSVRNRKG